MASSSQTNDNMEIKTFDLNDADVTEENGCWVFRFQGKPETISIGVIRMEDLIKGTQKTIFYYDDGTPVCEPIKIGQGDRRILVTLKNKIVIFNHIDEAVARLMAKTEEFSIRFCDENDNPVKEMHADTISETLKGVKGLIKNFAKLLGIREPKVEVKFNGCVGDMTFIISYPIQVKGLVLKS